MYYDNKSTFYIKQYGPAVFVIAISIVLVLSGLYIYLSSNTKNNSSKNSLTAKNSSSQDSQDANQANNNAQVDSLKDTEKQTNNENKIVSETSSNTVENKSDEKKEESIYLNNIKISTSLTSNLKSNDKLEKINDVTVLGIDKNLNLIVNISNTNYKASLIGVDYKKSNSIIKEKINSDLTGKKVSISFDNVKLQDSKLAVYVYTSDNELYNATLLKNGLATINVEKANTSLLNDLVNAQKYAKQNNLGIWKN